MLLRNISRVSYCSTTISKNISTLLMRSVSNRAEAKSSTNATVKKSVFISQSTDIYTNLALEDWLYKNYDFENHHVLMLWCNDPCVVIGRHQNPWMEANIGALQSMGVTLARRNSGGGTVYHDRGNLNLTFFTSKTKYNRKHNLEVISRALYKEWSLKTDISPREDLVVDGNLKVSGTAAKLGRLNAYHHCTLLVDANKTNLRRALQKKDLGLTSNATKSIPSSIANLNDKNPHVNVQTLMSAVGWEWLKTPITDSATGETVLQNGFQMINPTDDWFPGLEKLRLDLKDWNWVYGKSPKFTAIKDVSLVATKDKNWDLKLKMQVSQGKIDGISLFVPAGLSTMGFSGDAVVVSDLEGQRFDEAAVATLQNLFAASASAEKKCDSQSQTVKHVI